MKRALLALALLCIPLLSWAGSYDVLVVCDKSAATAYDDIGLVTPELVNQSQLLAVQRILKKWGARYRVMPPSALTTNMCATGLVYLNKTPNAYGFVAEGPVDTFAAVIHCGFNGTQASQFTGYRPDSATLTAKLPTVPQLYLLDSDADANSFQNGAADSTASQSAFGIAAVEHHFGGTYSASGRTTKFSSITGSTGAAKLLTGQNGGVRALLSQTVSTQALPQADYIGNFNGDTAVVWEKLNLHKAGSARIVFASVGSITLADSAGRQAHYRKDIEWPVLTFAIAHLDSLTGGRIIRRPAQFGFVIVGGGTHSDRRHPGGIFTADTTILKTSGDSVATTNAKIVVAAAPESLTAADAAQWKRFGNVRFTPWVRAGLDSGVAGNTKATAASPRDVWGRYRNRAFFGDSVYHAVAGDDTSIFQLYKGARANLAATVGQNYLSGLIVCPESDWSPYQMRRNQNAALVDSVAWVAAKLGCSAILVNTWGRDMDPSYLTNPKGYIFKQRRYTIRAASLRGMNINFIGHQQFTVMGSRVHSCTDALSFEARAAVDTALTEGFFYAQMPTYAMYSFWNSMYGPYDAVSWNDGAGLWNQTTTAPAWDSSAFDNVPGTHQPASVLQLPAQAFGGQDAAAPNRWGFYAIKHVMGAAALTNYAAGRSVMVNSWPEDITP